MQNLKNLSLKTLLSCENCLNLIEGAPNIELLYLPCRPPSGLNIELPKNSSKEIRLILGSPVCLENEGWNITTVNGKIYCFGMYVMDEKKTDEDKNNHHRLNVIIGITIPLVVVAIAAVGIGIYLFTKNKKIDDSTDTIKSALI